METFGKEIENYEEKMKEARLTLDRESQNNKMLFGIFASNLRGPWRREYTRLFKRCSYQGYRYLTEDDKAVVCHIMVWLADNDPCTPLVDERLSQIEDRLFGVARVN